MALLPKVKLKALISFPAQVNDGAGIEIVRTSSSYTFNLDFSDFAPVLGFVTDATHQSALLWNDTTGVYTLTAMSAFAGTPGSALPIMDSVATTGVSTLYSREDHIHPTDTTRAPLASPVFTGNPQAPTPTAGDSDTSVATTAFVAAAVTLSGIIKSVHFQKFTANGTYTPTVGMLNCIVECVGGGGGGGGVAGAVGQSYGGSGGGSGGYSRTMASAATIGASKAVLIGAGGTGSSGSGTAGGGNPTSVGALCIANGGGGGVSGTVAVTPTGGVGGVVGTGDIAATGAPGSNGGYASTTAATLMQGGNGGSSHLGGGAAGTWAISGGVSSGNSAVAGSGGGGGGASTNNTATTGVGGSGGSGIVFITEFCSV